MQTAAWTGAIVVDALLSRTPNATKFSKPFSKSSAPAGSLLLQMKSPQRP